MTSRGYVWAYYHSDNGSTFALKVDADYAAMASRGWAFPAVAGTPPYPRAWIPRRVVGVDSLGQLRSAIVAVTSADLWTGAASTFQIYGTDEALHTVTVTKLLREVWNSRP